jgi:hypothetical protein
MQLNEVRKLVAGFFTNLQSWGSFKSHRKKRPAWLLAHQVRASRSLDEYETYKWVNIAEIVS